MIKTYVFDKIIKQYEIPLEEVNDFNDRYEKNKKTLISWGYNLAGRLDSELAFNDFLQKTTMFSTIVKCMNDYIASLNNFGLMDDPIKRTHILSCWVNDMKQGEYNPPHIHNEGNGWSTVIFLKVPKFIDDTKDPHKFLDGKLGFMGEGSNQSFFGGYTRWHEPKVGDFYIFDSTHMHAVMPFKTENDEDIRRTMSFNFVLNNEKEKYAGPPAKEKEGN
jgi:hypothetical protein